MTPGITLNEYYGLSHQINKLAGEIDELQMRLKWQQRHDDKMEEFTSRLIEFHNRLASLESTTGRFPEIIELLRRMLPND